MAPKTYQRVSVRMSSDVLAIVDAEVDRVQKLVPDHPFTRSEAILNLLLRVRQETP